MKLQYAVWELEQLIEESFGKDSYEVELFDWITQRLWEYEADVIRYRWLIENDYIEDID